MGESDGTLDGGFSWVKIPEGWSFGFSGFFKEQMASRLGTWECWVVGSFTCFCENSRHRLKHTTFCEIFECHWGIPCFDLQIRMSPNQFLLCNWECSIFLNEFCVVVCLTIFCEYLVYLTLFLGWISRWWKPGSDIHILQVGYGESPWFVPKIRVSKSKSQLMMVGFLKHQQYDLWYLVYLSYDSMAIIEMAWECLVSPHDAGSPVPQENWEDETCVLNNLERFPLKKFRKGA